MATPRLLPHRGRPLPMTGAVLSLALLLAACSSSSTDQVASLETEGEPTAAVGDEAGDAEAAAVEFVECMRDEGFDLPDPTVDADGNVTLGGGAGGGPGGPGGGEGGPGDGSLVEDFADASEQCGGIPEGLVGGFAAADQTAFQDAALEFTQCLRDGGLDVDDPDFSGFGEGGGPGGQGQGGGPLGDLDLDDPEVAEVFEDCQALLADAGFPGAGGGDE